jgi:hypothetical protein
MTKNTASGLQTSSWFLEGNRKLRHSLKRKWRHELNRMWRYELNQPDSAASVRLQGDGGEIEVVLDTTDHC